MAKPSIGPQQVAEISTAVNRVTTLQAALQWLTSKDPGYDTDDAGYFHIVVREISAVSGYQLDQIARALGDHGGSGVFDEKFHRDAVSRQLIVASSATLETCSWRWPNGHTRVRMRPSGFGCCRVFTHHGLRLRRLAMAHKATRTMKEAPVRDLDLPGFMRDRDERARSAGLLVRKSWGSVWKQRQFVGQTALRVIGADGWELRTDYVGSKEQIAASGFIWTNDSDAFNWPRGHMPSSSAAYVSPWGKRRFVGRAMLSAYRSRSRVHRSSLASDPNLSAIKSRGGSAVLWTSTMGRSEIYWLQGS